ncbi:MAG: HEAT repeat domain-containing protein [Candidatus Lokiarchaeota archaeon]|nr:HEAT repeat domain-containing protein [Candidatus Lokiarchaeota archaeon]
MSRELRDLIDSIDSANQAHSDLVTVIKYLKEEVQRLNSRVNEQKRIIQNQGSKISKFDDSDIPEDVLILKEMITNQREDINKKDNHVKILEQGIEELTKSLELTNNSKSSNEELNQANILIAQLKDENEKKKNEIDTLKQKFEKLNEEGIFIGSGMREDEYQELIDAKKIIFQLIEENGLTKVKLESVKAERNELEEKFQEAINANENYQNEVDLANNAIEHLTEDLNETQEKVTFLKNKIDSFQIQEDEELSKLRNNSTTIDELLDIISDLETDKVNFLQEVNAKDKRILDLKESKESFEERIAEQEKLIVEQQTEFKRLLDEKDSQLSSNKEDSIRIENANQQLNELIIELKNQEDKLLNQRKEIPPQIIPPVSPPVVTTISYPVAPPFNSLPQNLFLKMLQFLDSDNKNKIVDQLIEDLKHPEREIKTGAIKLLSLIDSEKTFHALKNLMPDPDWIVKLYLIKAFFKFDNPEVMSLLSKFKSDDDLDVRETAERTIEKLKRVKN